MGLHGAPKQKATVIIVIIQLYIVEQNIRFFDHVFMV